MNSIKEFIWTEIFGEYYFKPKPNSRFFLHLETSHKLHHIDDICKIEEMMGIRRFDWFEITRGLR